MEEFQGHQDKTDSKFFIKFQECKNITNLIFIFFFSIKT